MTHHPKPCASVSLNSVRFNSDIPPGARILFAEFLEWSKENGSFPYETKALANMYSVSAFTIRKWMKILAKHDLINLTIDLSKGLETKLINVKAAVT